MADSNNGWLNTKQVAYLCSVTPTFLVKRRMARLPPAYHRIGAKVLYKQVDVDAWLASTRQEPK